MLQNPAQPKEFLSNPTFRKKATEIKIWVVTRELLNQEMTESNSSGDSDGMQEGHGCSAGGWFFSRKEIEENSPSRRDGIDLKKETYLRKSYCTFLQDLGMQLKVPQVTIATAVIFCHRFFIRQSHAKNDRRTIATVCMFLAGKVEETPRPLKDVIIVSYGIIHKKDPGATQRIKQKDLHTRMKIDGVLKILMFFLILKEVYEQHKERILIGEQLVLATLAFDLNVLHPYKPLVDAIRRFNLAQNDVPRISWNFVNDALRTSLWLQFKPHIIAAGAISLAARFRNVKFPSDGGRVWWQDFDVESHQLEDVSSQMMELYDSKQPAVKLQTSDENLSAQDGHTQSAAVTVTKQSSAASPVQSADQMCGDEQMTVSVSASNDGI